MKQIDKNARNRHWRKIDYLNFSINGKMIAEDNISHTIKHSREVHYET